jgi:precorrin-6B methylase 2
MRYVEQSVGSALYPKLLGTYEKELQPVIERLCAKGYLWIIDVGAAEGYYAIGMALRCEDAHVVAFESVETGRQLIRQLAQLNRIENKVEIHGHCDPGILQKQLKESAWFK